MRGHCSSGQRSKSRQNMPDRYGTPGRGTNTCMGIWLEYTNLKLASQKSSQMVRPGLMKLTLDSPLKRFAQRFTYNGLDQIALRDLGFGSRQPPPSPPAKRPLPESPRPASPVKRPRAESPRPPPQRFRDRTPRSPPRREPPVIPPPRVSAPPTYSAYRPLVHFVGSLPSARSFNGKSSFRITSKARSRLPARRHHGIVQ